MLFFSLSFYEVSLIFCRVFLAKIIHFYYDNFHGLGSKNMKDDKYANITLIEYLKDDVRGTADDGTTQEMAASILTSKQ